MIREILERSEIKISWKALNHFNKCTTYEIEIDGKYFYESIDNKYNVVIRILEKACQQYVKENGFKSKWFSEEIQKFVLITKSLEILLGVWLTTSDNPKEERQLLAWLYSNDIEITND
jgi:hypothetical protein